MGPLEVEVRYQFVRAGELFTARYTPQHCTAGGATYLVCPPILFEHYYSYNTICGFCEAICANGASVVRLDYIGHGNSALAHKPITVDTLVGSVVDALHWLLQECPQVALVGFRCGAPIAHLASSEIGRDTTLLATFDAIDDFRRYGREVRRHRAAVRATWYGERTSIGEETEILGYTVSAGLFDEFTHRLDGRWHNGVACQGRGPSPYWRRHGGRSVGRQMADKALQHGLPRWPNRGRSHAQGCGLPPPQ